MRYKKYSYIIVAILMLLVGMNKTYAYYEKTCNYLSDNNEAMARLTIKWGYSMPNFHMNKGYSEATFEKLGSRIDNDTEHILNWYTAFDDSSVTGLVLNGIYYGKKAANQNPTCPEYLIMRTKTNYRSYGAFATQSSLEAEKFVNASNSIDGYEAWVLTFKNDDGTEITDEQYYSGFISDAPIFDPNAKITCSDLFGDESDEDSLAYMINLVLDYVRIIVPILVIVLGLFDLGKAVIASKEDEMKKAQLTFTKRVIIGVVVFFIPVLVNIVMDFADIVWDGMGYTVCEYK